MDARGRDPVSDLETRIADVLSEHMDGKRTFEGVATDHEHLITVRCPCGWTQPNVPFLKVAPVIAWQAHVAEALAPVIREREEVAWDEGYVCLQVGINPYKEQS